MKRRTQPRRDRPTRRQLECLYLVRLGRSSSDISAALGISSRTVDEYVTACCEFYGVRRRYQSVLEAIALGHLPP